MVIVTKASCDVKRGALGKRSSKVNRTGSASAARPSIGIGQTMLAIILSACMANDPGVCKDYKIPLSVDIDPQSFY